VTGRLVILGAGGHGRAVADLARACGWTVAGFTERAQGPSRADVLGGDEDVPALIEGGRADGAALGVGNTALRRRVELFQRLRTLRICTPSLVHPGATASPSCRVGDGTVVFAACVLGAAVEIGENAVLYSGVLVEHDCRVGDHAYLSPGVILSGAVVVEPGAFVGAGAIVLPGLSIGENAVVGAGAVVTTDVPPGRTVIGSPARARADR
jgi:sugar O-acyltransferase (sialic acid O-acetyltransferase NeuD family)